MPANYAVVSEDEMTYVDGGAYHSNCWAYKNSANLYDSLNTLAQIFALYSCYSAVAGSMIGASIGLGGGTIGACIGAAIGAISGFIGGSVLYSWATAVDTAALDARNISGACVVKFELNNLTMRFTVTAIDYSRNPLVTVD